MKPISQFAHLISGNLNSDVAERSEENYLAL